MIDFNTHNPTAEQMPQNQQHNNMVYQLNAPSHLPVTANTPENYFNNQYQTETSNSGMRSNFPLAVNPLSSAPLAALHSMAGSGDMKTSQAMTSPTLAGYNPAAYYSMKNGLNCLNGTPHGITDILSRPDLQALQARLGQGMYYNSCSQGGGQMGSPSKDSRHVYWTSSDGQPINNMHHQQEGWPLKHDVGIEKGPDGKKKNTRPTFSGSQIFALEKTFEQQKYLAGPERGRLAYALGMSESQVKVWFQNRRTKWRKRHAVEQVSKRRGGNPPSQTPPSYEQSQKSNQLSTSNFDNINIGGNNLHAVLN